MQLKGGIAGMHSVSFYSDRYAATTVNKKQATNVYVNKREQGPRFLENIMKWPFIRAYALFLYVFLIKRKMIITVLLSYVLIIFLNISREDNSMNHMVLPETISPLLFLALLLGGAAFVIRLTPIGKYHAAEHMAANAYGHSGDLRLENVKQYSRISRYCGTNLVILFLIVFTILYMIFGFHVGIAFFAWGMTYEMRQYDQYLSYIITPIYYVGYAAQYLLFTSKPNDKHLQAAIKAIQALEKQESTTD
ncbi:DUF1385 domain-containing protein [Salibacterium aidingense]|uniref:DUF1385 domain-containing protein n=1 Tax=Salibacterium aidingense TaxID=384933 RepID=UPI0003FF0E22|nr:DUF1385 domain-containing protein [Salibacterium aidingense]